MRNETGDWLAPMFEAANERPDIDTAALMQQSTMPAAENVAPMNPILNRIADTMPGAVKAIDWVRFGELLRHELGWDDTYPAMPDFPETRDMP